MFHLLLASPTPSHCVPGAVETATTALRGRRFMSDMPSFDISPEITLYNSPSPSSTNSNPFDDWKRPTYGGFGGLGEASGLYVLPEPPFPLTFKPKEVFNTSPKKQASLPDITNPLAHSESPFMPSISSNSTPSYHSFVSDTTFASSTPTNYPSIEPADSMTLYTDTTLLTLHSDSWSQVSQLIPSPNVSSIEDSQTQYTSSSIPSTDTSIEDSVDFPVSSPCVLLNFSPPKLTGNIGYSGGAPCFSPHSLPPWKPCGRFVDSRPAVQRVSPTIPSPKYPYKRKDYGRFVDSRPAVQRVSPTIPSPKYPYKRKDYGRFVDSRPVQHITPPIQLPATPSPTKPLPMELAEEHSLFDTTTLSISPRHKAPTPFNSTVSSISPRHEAPTPFNSTTSSISPRHEAPTPFNSTTSSISSRHKAPTPFNSTTSSISPTHESPTSFDSIDSSIFMRYEAPAPFHITISMTMPSAMPIVFANDHLDSSRYHVPGSWPSTEDIAINNTPASSWCTNILTAVTRVLWRFW